MSDTTIIALGILFTVLVITVVALFTNRVSQALPIITLVFGLAGGGAIGSVAADQASQNAADDAAAKAVKQVQQPGR